MEEIESENLENLPLQKKVNLIIKALKIDQKTKEQKKFKFLPKLGKGQLKKNYAIIIFIRTNGYLDIMKLPIEDGFVYVKKVDMRYSVTADSVMRWNNLPVIIIQEWSLEPLSPTMLQRKTFDEKMKSYPQKILIDALKKGQIAQKKLNANIILWLLIGIAAIFIIFSLLKIKIA